MRASRRRLRPPCQPREHLPTAPRHHPRDGQEHVQGLDDGGTPPRLPLRHRAHRAPEGHPQARQRRAIWPRPHRACRAAELPRRPRCASSWPSPHPQDTAPGHRPGTKGHPHDRDQHRHHRRRDRAHAHPAWRCDTQRTPEPAALRHRCGAVQRGADHALPAGACRAGVRGRRGALVPARSAQRSWRPTRTT